MTNQITHASVPFEDPFYEPSLTEGQDNLQATAALGLTWAHSVNIRIILQYWREDVRTVSLLLFVTIFKITHSQLIIQ